MKEKRKDIFENYNKNPDEKDIEVSSAPSGAGIVRIDRPLLTDLIDDIANNHFRPRSTEDLKDAGKGSNMHFSFLQAFRDDYDTYVENADYRVTVVITDALSEFYRDQGKTTRPEILIGEIRHIKILYPDEPGGKTWAVYDIDKLEQRKFKVIHFDELCDYHLDEENIIELVKNSDKVVEITATLEKSVTGGKWGDMHKIRIIEEE